MYDLFLFSSSRRADPRDASLVEISLQRFPYKYRAAVIARRAFSTKVRIDKKRSLPFLFFRDFNHEFYSGITACIRLKRVSRETIK